MEEPGCVMRVPVLPGYRVYRNGEWPALKRTTVLTTALLCPSCEYGEEKHLAAV